MKAVFLDATTLGNDLDFTALEQATGGMVKHDATSQDEVAERIRGFDTVLVNKVVLTREHFENCPELKTIAVVATGLNNIDQDAARDRGIQVLNVTNYGRSTVAQHTMALMLALATRLLDYDRDVRAGRWAQSDMFCLMNHPIMELEGRTLGIVGYGDLGRALPNGPKPSVWRFCWARGRGRRQGGRWLPRLPLDELCHRWMCSRCTAFSPMKPIT